VGVVAGALDDDGVRIDPAHRLEADHGVGRAGGQAQRRLAAGQHRLHRRADGAERARVQGGHPSPVGHLHAGPCHRLGRVDEFAQPRQLEVPLGGLAGAAEHLRRAAGHRLGAADLVVGPVDLHADRHDAVDRHAVPAAAQHGSDDAAERVAEHGHRRRRQLGGQFGHVGGVHTEAVRRFGQRQPVPAEVRRGPPARPLRLVLREQPGPHGAGRAEPVQQEQQRPLRAAARVRDAPGCAPHQSNLRPVSNS
jgi:hypothetical protein